MTSCLCAQLPLPCCLQGTSRSRQLPHHMPACTAGKSAACRHRDSQSSLSLKSSLEHQMLQQQTGALQVRQHLIIMLYML